MNIHKFCDLLVEDLSNLALLRIRLFGESLDSPTFEEHLRGITFDLPPIKGEGFFALKAETLFGYLNPAFHVAQWKGKEFPTILYHHGNNERPFNYKFYSLNTFKWILHSRKNEIPANLISLRAAFHENLKEYLTGLQSLSIFVAALSVSVVLIEKLVFFLRENVRRQIIVSGISLGGFVTNLHRAYFNSADIYIPLLAGARIGDVLTTPGRKMANPVLEKNAEKLRRILNFEDNFLKVKGDNVFPLLARYDQIIDYESQKRCYGKQLIAVLGRGHITGALAGARIRQHILDCLGSRMEEKKDLAFKSSNLY